MIIGKGAASSSPHVAIGASTGGRARGGVGVIFVDGVIVEGVGDGGDAGATAAEFGHGYGAVISIGGHGSEDLLDEVGRPAMMQAGVKIALLPLAVSRLFGAHGRLWAV